MITNRAFLNSFKTKYMVAVSPSNASCSHVDNMFVNALSEQDAMNRVDMAVDHIEYTDSINNVFNSKLNNFFGITFAQEIRMSMIKRFGKDNTWTGNARTELKKLFDDSYTDEMASDTMNNLVKKYASTHKFSDRMRQFTVLRWSKSKNIPFEDMLNDWMELGLITKQNINDSLIIKNYEDSVAVDDFIAARKLEIEESAATLKQKKKMHNI